MSKRTFSIFTLVVLCIGVFFILFYIKGAPFTSNAKEVVIKFERLPCFGSCPIYNLTIYGNGLVIYEGVDFVDVKGYRIKFLSKQVLENLLTEFEKANFYSLSDKYTDGPTDMDSIILTLSVNGDSKKIWHYGTFCGVNMENIAPPELCELEYVLEEISEYWVKGIQ